MKSRERVIKALEFGGPDRIPYFSIFPWRSDVFPLFMVTPSSWQPAEPYMPYVQPIEVQSGAWRAKRRLPRGWLRSKHVAIDEWGVTWERNGAITSLGQVLDGPIKTWDDLDTYQFPDPHDPARFSLMTKLARVFGGGKYKLGSIGNFFYERYHFLRGWERSMQDIVRAPARAGELLDRLLDHYLALVDEWIARGVDGIICTDDLGGQTEPLMSPAAYKRLFIPRVKKVFDHCHDHGVHFVMHSCGDVKELMPALVDAGLDAFQFDGPDQTGVAWCGERFGGKVAFMNVADIQHVIPATTNGDIEAYVKKMIYHLGRFDGGLIGIEYATAGDLKPQRGAFRRMHAAYKAWGTYPLDLDALHPFA